MAPRSPKPAQKGPVPGAGALTVSEALRGALGSAVLTGADGAAVALAERLAVEIDGGGDVEKLAPRLLAVLAALNMTPAARASVARGGAADGGRSGPADALARLRAERARAH